MKISNLYFLKFIFFIIVSSSFIMCKNKNEKKNSEIPIMTYTEEELYRPNYHFTPKKNWMNDPNGMFYLNGKYHLFFQYYPEDNIWGPMHWGHAVTEDLITWKELPIALYPDSLGYIFSGSAVVDINNSSGFGEDGIVPVVAIFTYHDMERENEGAIDYQSQALAYSLDEGLTWIKYDGNPVLPNPGIKDFRDPKVIWDEERNTWLMALATYEKTFFYTSLNLKEWELLSDFGEYIGAHEGVWECPDFFPITVEGTNETKWVLLQSLNPGHINGGSGTQYFVGDFNGKTFELDLSFANKLKKNQSIWLDYGRDNYAGVTWSNIPKDDGRKLFIGWMSNWDYAKQVPTETWRSAMTIARELKLKKVEDSYVLYSEPVKELDKFKKEIDTKTNINFSSEYLIVDNQKNINKSLIEISLSNLKQDIYTFQLTNDKGDEVKFGINNKDLFYFIDRTKSGDLSFSKAFANKISKAKFEKTHNEINIQILLDKTSIELFYNDGKTSMTEIFFPKIPYHTLKISTLNGSKTTIDKLTVSLIDIN